MSSGDNVTDPDGPQDDQENCDVVDLCTNTDIELEDPQGESSSENCDHDTSHETIGYCYDEAKHKISDEDSHDELNNNSSDLPFKKQKSVFQCSRK